MNIKRAASLLLNNPGLFVDKVTYRIRLLKLRLLNPIQDVKSGGVSFQFDLNMDRNIKHMFLGGYEKGITKILRAYLKEGDTFIDVGANIGYMSFIAAQCVGSKGKVYAFEPVPQYYQKLKDFADMNRGFKIFIHNVALANRQEAEMLMDVSKNNIGWNTIVQHLMPKQVIKESIQVRVVRFDSYMEKQ